MRSELLSEAGQSTEVTGKLVYDTLSLGATHIPASDWSDDSQGALSLVEMVSTLYGP